VRVESVSIVGMDGKIPELKKISNPGIYIDGDGKIPELEVHKLSPLPNQTTYLLTTPPSLPLSF